jgi:hypothetical protein
LHDGLNEHPLTIESGAARLRIAIYPGRIKFTLRNQTKTKTENEADNSALNDIYRNTSYQ